MHSHLFHSIPFLSDKWWLEYINFILISGSTNGYLLHLKNCALENKTDMVVCFLLGHFLTLSVSGSCSTQVVYHASGAFGKNSRYRCNFVYPPHFADEETETQWVKLLLESKNPVMFHSSMQFSFYHKCRNIAIGNTFSSSVKVENMSENCFTNHSKSHFKESVENFQAQSVIEFFV